MFSKITKNHNEELGLFTKKLLITIASIIVLIFVLNISDILIILGMAWFLNILFSPFLNKMNKIRISDWIWMAIIWLVIVFLVFLVISAAVPIFAKQISYLISNISSGLADFKSQYTTWWLEKIWLPWFISNPLASLKLDTIIEILRNNASEISSFVWKYLKWFMSWWFNFVSSVTWMLTNITLLVIFTFFMAIERKDIRKFTYDVLPEKFSSYFKNREDKISESLAWWMKWQILLWISIFAITYIWLLILSLFWVNLSDKFSLAVIAWMMEFVPYLWPILAFIPAFAISIQMWIHAILAVIVLYIAIQQIENNFIVPYVMSKTLSVSPFAILLAMTVWASSFWIIWIILSVPAVSVLSILISDWINYRKEK